MSLTDIASVRQRLLECLDAVPAFEECALLGYPEHHNVGDHLIWLGALQWIRQTRKARLTHVSSIGEFSQKSLDASLGKGPIILTGGGNFGDHWPREQEFRDRIVRFNRDRPIVILPQSIYFSTPDSIQAARLIFNEHPDLTLLTRDDISFEKTKKHFPNAKNVLAPDMSLMLAGSLERPVGGSGLPKEMLWLHRRDREQMCDFLIAEEEGWPLSVADWPSMNSWTRFLQRFVRKAPALLRWAQASRGGNSVAELARSSVRNMLPILEGVPDALFQRRSLRIIAEGAHFLERYGLVVTDRLHGHLFSTLLGIPNVLLPNIYHKNEGFFRCWTSAIASCRFTVDAQETRKAIRELAALKG